MLRHAVALGTRVKKGKLLGHVSDPYSGQAHDIICPTSGVVIGCVNLPIVHEGEALFHIARFNGAVTEVVETVDSFQQVHAETEPEEPDRSCKAVTGTWRALADGVLADQSRSQARLSRVPWSMGLTVSL